MMGISYQKLYSYGVNELVGCIHIQRNMAKRYFMRIIVSVHEAYLLFSALIQPPHHALPVQLGTVRRARGERRPPVQ